MIYRQMGLLDFIFRRGLPVSTAVTPTDPPAATPAPQLLNPGLSRAERKFLSQFTAGFTFEPQHGGHWDQVLPLPRAKQIPRFLSAGLVEPADLATKLNRHLSGAELKALLRERGLAVSGRKDAGIGRLIAADGAGAAALVSDMEVYVCTAQGKQIAEEFIAAEKDESRRARELSLQRLRANDLHGALMGVYEFERQQVFSRGVGCDWSRDPSADETARLRHVFEARPQILKDVSEHEWSALQIAAAMLQLWGESKAGEWLPAEVTGASNLDRETAVRMILFAGVSRATLEQLARADIKQVEVLDSDDSSCPACRRMAKRKYRVSHAPELPCPECTSPMGCRCTFVTVI